MLFLILGSSGSGKTTQKEILTTKYGFKKITTYTTRKKREGEKDGVDYFFLSREEFLKKVEENFFFEYTTYCDNFYGTSKSSIEAASKSREKYILIVESHGAEVIKKELEAKAIYIKIPKSIIRSRLLKRGDDESSIKNRMVDLENYRKICDYVIDGTLPIESVTEEILKITGEMK